MPITVLFVDDELAVLQGLMRRLRNENWQMRTATSGEDALAQLARNPADVIVSDWQMAGISGAELLNKVSRLYPSCKRIMLTGRPNPILAQHTVESGVAHRFLTKPFEPEVLAGIIRELTSDGDSKSTASTRTETSVPPLSNDRFTHEINNQFTIINGQCDIVLGMKNLDPEIRKALTVIRAVNTRAADLLKKGPS